VKGQTVRASDVEVGKPVELTMVLGKLGHRQFLYRTEAGALVRLPHRIRGTKDIRPYDEQHPVWVKAQKGAEHWSPVGGLGVDTAALFAFFHRPKVTVNNNSGTH
jgi:hypothetical protein